MLCFLNDSCVGWVQEQARWSGGCGVIAAVARSTFWSQNAKKLGVSGHFLKFRCRKIARRCGEKHIFKWKCTKHVSVGPLFEVRKVRMSKNCTSMRLEAHVQVKMLKNRRCRSTFWSSDVEKLHAAVARSTFPGQNVKKLTFTLSQISMLENCTPLWREARCEVKMCKTC